MLAEIAESRPDLLVLADDLPGWSPATLWRAWTEPALLERWWPPAAALSPQLGGTYHFEWPRLDWHLRGIYTRWEPGAQLAFTWRWDHDPADRPERLVQVRFAPAGPGAARLTISHGPYSDTPADRRERVSHLQGWAFFAASLVAAIDPAELG